jgi:predicted Zn-dependent protease
MVVSEKLAQYAQYAMSGMQLLFLKFSRDNEREADRLGVEYSSKIGYDAHKMADFFQVLNKMSMAESVGGVPTFLSTHPDPGDRYNSVNQQATDWQDSLKLPSWIVNGDEYLQMIDGIVYGEDPRQGYTENSVFYHPALRFKFSYPAGWNVENTPGQVNFAPSDSKALMIFTMSSEKSLQAAADSTVARLGLTIVESNKTTVSGMPAIAVLSQQIKQDQSTGAQSITRILSYYIDYNSRYYILHGVSTDNDFTAYSGAFESSMKSFSVLTDESKINVKPKKILIKKVNATGTLTNALTYYGMKQEQMSELALLNDIELSDQVQAGKLIKIIGE